MPTKRGPSLAEVVAQIVRELKGPAPLEEIVDRVLERKPSRARDPRAPIRGEIRMSAFSFGLVYADLERKVVVPVQIAMRGIRFRHVMTEEEISRRMLLWNESDGVYLAGPYLPPDFDRPDLQLVDRAGQIVAADRVSISSPGFDLFGFPFASISGRQLAAFLRQHPMRAGDSLLFTIEQFDPPRWRMEHEPQAQRDQAAIDCRNRQLLDSLFRMLEESPNEYIDPPVSVRSALFQVPDPTGYPGDPWMAALQRDGRMRVGFTSIEYAGSEPRSFIDGILSSYDEYDPMQEMPVLDELPPLPEADAQRVYTFKINPVYRKSPWRRVEALGEETLAGLNNYLVELFKHDNDHLGGFWRIVSRGKGERVREVKLATVDPFGGDRGSDLRIAELNLAAGDRLKWVYDFGDRNEYQLQFEAVMDPQTSLNGNDYPRVVAANKPQLLYCASCRARGKQTVATWYCATCSEQQDEPVMLCEQCSRLRKHEEHYLEEWVY